MYAQVNNKIDYPENKLSASPYSQPLNDNTEKSSWDCFNGLEETLKDLNGVNYRLDQQSELLMKISTELKSIETNLVNIQKTPLNSEPIRRKKILKPRKTHSRTIMHKILNTDTQNDDQEVEIIVPGIKRQISKNNSTNSFNDKSVGSTRFLVCQKPE